MLKAKKWLASLLLVSLLFNLIPLDVLAEELVQDETVVEAPVAPEESPDSTEEPSQEPSPEVTPAPSEEPEESPTPETPEDPPAEEAPPAEEEPVVEGETPTEEPSAVDPAEAELETVTLLFENNFANSFAAVLTENGYSTDLIKEKNGITLTIKDANVLALLSQQKQTADSHYQDWTLSFGNTGNLVLPDNFIGLGDDDVPFKGTFDGSVSSIKTKHSLFKCLSSKATLASIPIKWTGTQDEAIFAEKLVLHGNYDIPMSLSFDNQNQEKGAFSPFIGTLSYGGGAYTATLPSLDYTNADPQSVSAVTTDIGLLCRRLENNVSLYVSALTLPDGTKLQFSSTANTGGLVGSMAGNSKLIISQKLTLDVLLIGGDSAGGLVGSMKTGATIDFADGAGVDITAELKATNAGGIAGVVATTNGPLHYPYVPPEPTPEPAGEEATPELAGEEVSPAPAGEEVSPAPADEEVSPAPADEEAAPEPADKEVSPAPADEEATPEPADEDVTASPEEPDNGNIFASLPLFSALINLLSSLFLSDEPSAQPDEGPLENVRIRSVKANGSSNAGVLYGSCTVTGAFDPFYGVTFTADATKEVSGPNNCGGVFGTLELNGIGKCTIYGTEETPQVIASTLKISNTIVGASATGKTTQYGGIAGTLSGADRKNALVVTSCEITSTVSVGDNTENYPKYLGGLVAVQGPNSTVDAGKSTVTISNPKTPLNTNSIGGLCTTVGDGALLIADTMKVVIDSFVENQGSSGVAASTGKGAIVYLQTSLDLSACLLSTCAYSAQIVGKQDSSLIYAPNVEISRLKTDKYSGMELDDIGNYGELYRIAGFLTVDKEKNYGVSFNRTLSKTGEAYVLNDALDFACLALAWQSRGNFPTVDGITASEWSTSNPKSSTITLGASIDLSHCGIGGLTRDAYSSDDVFTGTFNGGGNTLTLDIGRRNVANDISTGDGRIYWHNATGLFAALGGSASVSNLKLAGRIRLSNNKLGTMYSGALAAQVNDSQTEGSTLSKVSTHVAYDAKVNGANYLYLGGLIGQISSGSAKIDFDADTSLKSNITVSHSGNGSTNHFGGAIGAIAKDTSANITCSGASISGKIESTGTLDNLYAGGLIGTILGGSGERKINITSLTVNDFTLTGNASQRMGGILGGIWADTNVEITGLTTAGTSLTANSNAELGGLVYRASGKWTVSSVDLSGLTINAKNTTKALGLLVCHGDPYKDVLNATSLNTDMNALYLEMTQDWDTGYKVPKVNGFGTNVFDEFVTYTAYANRTDTSANYDITHNGGGIISLKTENGTVNMGKSDNRNTYVNRVEGVTVPTNQYSRYYYNLDSIIDNIKEKIANSQALAQAKADAAALAAAEAEAAAAGTDDAALLAAVEEAALAAQTAAEEAAALTASPTEIDDAERLLIWSVWKYSASNLKNYFKINGNEWETYVGGASAAPPASFDMKGLSYYPIDITNENITNESITVQYANVKFYNAEIEAKEVGSGTDDTAPKKNKLTRENTQHYTMHCGLFHDFEAETATGTDYTLTVNGVSFAGTVGVVNNGSGALLCGNVAGQDAGGNTSVCKVILADEDKITKAVTLNGISVAPVGNYTPVLINKIGDYSELSAMYLTTGNGQTEIIAGSSLIGDVGSENASKLNITFGGTIKLPEQKTGEGQVFTKATLLNSLRYATGSAVYNFAKEKDYSGNTFVHNATHGWELDKDVSVEYVDEDGNSKLGKYLKLDVFVSKNGNFITNNDFSGDLPYVAFSPATKDNDHPLANNWHELAVNLPSTNLETGCGTYGHPYQVNSNTFRAVANYINTGVAVEGWEISVPADSDYHNGDGHDTALIFQDGKWIKKNTKEAHEGDVRTHLQNAYYQLSGNITLNNFHGVGANPDSAFKGVIDGNNYYSVTLTGNSSAFIKYSYGCVVRDVTFILQQTPKLNREAWTRGTPEQAPKTFFGGVIGCVLGGDNIIDNVKINDDNTRSILSMLFSNNSFQLNLEGTDPYLIPVGGYVGVIAGGGVIFRGNCSESVSLATTYKDESIYHIYKNPIIGRVLGGYAFYESSEEDSKAPNNSDKNYTINKITPVAQGDKDLVWSDSTLTVNSAQGLLLLSAIVSSGAGSTQSNAYTKGVARNAAYNGIGADEKPDDYDTATQDIARAVPYLLKQYAGCAQLSDICAKSNVTNGINIEFANTTFDMSGYGNGYRGLSARYVSNAAFAETGSPVDASAVVLRVKTFDGQNATVQNISMDVKEYANDDFHAASLGGIFNIVWTQKQSGGGGDGSNFAQNLTLQNCNVSLKYVGSSGAEVNQANTTTLSDADGRFSISVGGFIGMANDIDASQGSINHNYLFTNIHIGGVDNKNCQIYGPNGVGGLIGTTAMASTKLTGYPGILLANGKWALFGPNFLNCSYSNIQVSGGMAAGGLVGDAYASSSGNPTGFSGLGISYDSNPKFLCYASCTVTNEGLTVGQNSTITARAKQSIAAGIFGAAGMRVGVNEPEASRQEKTGLTISGTPSTLRLSNVNVQVSSDKEFDSGSYPDSGKEYAYAGGIIARIGSVNPGCFYDISISGGTVKSSNATASRVGGIIGSGYTNSTITMQRCHISNAAISGAHVGGFLGYGLDSPFKFYLLDSIIENSTVTGSSSTGGLVGYAKGTYYFNNILIKNSAITGGTNRRLIGSTTATKTDFSIYAAGISVYVDPQKSISIPDQDLNQTDYVGYIAYADYAGTDTAVSGQQSPYVTVIPNYTLSGVNKLMTGDAVGKIERDTYNSVAARIWADQKGETLVKKNRVSYRNVSDIVKNAVPEVSTFQLFQKYKDEETSYTNFPVLVLKGGDASPIENYLNVITNGGYATAKAKAKDYVTVETPKVYYYSTETHTFAEATPAQLNEKPASIIKTASNTFEVKTGGYDNTLNRFTLLEFKFKTTTVDGSNKYYTVSIPVVVERELQYDFMATFTPGAVFDKKHYANLTDHILESTGTPITAYLTYRYNRNRNSYVEYDWQSYVDSEEGPNMLIGNEAMDKILSFDGGMPKGTQMILVDCQTGNQAYQYEVPAGGRTSVKLSEFKSVCDDKVSFRPSLGVALGITAAEDSHGNYVKQTTYSADAILLKDGAYYRWAKNTDTGTRYALTVPDLEKNTAEENYYLVVTVPVSPNPYYKLNGNLSSSLDWGVPTSGFQVRRFDSTIDDARSETESTYQISSGYRQSLRATTEVDTVKMDSTEKHLVFGLKDTISFEKDQLYTENDKLFLKFSASLMSYVESGEGENKTTTSKPVQFLSGSVKGTVEFYVQDDEGYYVPNEDGWKRQTSKTVAASYNWESNGGNIELPLARKGANGEAGQALDLSAVRTAVKDSEDSGTGTFTVTANMEVTFGNADFLEKTIPNSAKNGVDTYAKLHYLSRISTLESSLNFSTARATVPDNVKYFRAVQENATLSMDASNIDQLGVNPLQLVETYQKTVNNKNSSQIDLTATLDMVTAEKAQAFLEKTEQVQFNLTLYQRKDEENGEKYKEVDKPDELMAVEWPKERPEDSTNWSWTISKEAFKTDFFNGTQFTFPLTAYVYTDPTGFANYKLKISVSFKDAGGNELADLPTLVDTDAYVVYTYACIKPTFYDPS